MPLVRPVFLVDNVFSPVQYPTVTLTANEEAAGHDAEYFAALRRETGWSPITFNATAWLKAHHTVPRTFDMICLWVHDLLGEQYQFQVSDDDFTTTQTVVDVVIPTSPGTGHVDDALGVLTEDYMWMKRVPQRSAHDFRHNIPAMGASQKPELAGIVGLSYSPAQYDFPYDPQRTELRVEEHMSDRGVMGRGPAANIRRGEITMKMRSDFDHAAARYHLEQRWGGWEPSPMLIVHNESQAHRAVMAVRASGSMLGFASDTSWPDAGEGRSYGTLTWLEHDPRGVNA